MSVGCVGGQPRVLLSTNTALFIQMYPTPFISDIFIHQQGTFCQQWNCIMNLYNIRYANNFSCIQIQENVINK